MNKKVLIVVSGGVVQDIYKLLSSDIDVEILDIDDLEQGDVCLESVKHFVTDPEWKEIVPDDIQEMINEMPEWDLE